MRSNVLKAAYAASSLAAAGVVSSRAEAQSFDDLRVTAMMPVIVEHIDPSTTERGWNQGFLQNPGFIVQADVPVMAINDDTDLRVGVTAGVYQNSIFKTSLLAGVNVEIETRLTDKFSLQAGSPFGVLTGYNETRPGAAPYVGATYAVTDDVRIGVRAEWLPAKTASEVLHVGNRSTSDAIIGLLSVSYEF